MPRYVIHENTYGIGAPIRLYFFLPDTRIKKTNVPPVNGQKEVIAPSEPDYESTDSGWDPYITALLTGAADAGGEQADDDGTDDLEPVMSFSRRPAKFAPSR